MNLFIKDSELTVAIIPARGGSKGIPRKNLIQLLNKPLIAWSIIQARGAIGIDSVWVSSDNEDILQVAKEFGANTIKRPEHLAGDNASSESAWIHSIESIESMGHKIKRVIGIQATSPLRESRDFDNALRKFEEESLDSLFSACEIADFFIWRNSKNGSLEGVNHDPYCRKRRQETEVQFLENGSFYIFTPELIKKSSNRIGGKTGVFLMEKYKMFQIDDIQDISLCERIMRGFGLNEFDRYEETP